MKIFSFIIIFLSLAVFSQAQITSETASGRERSEPLPQSILETLAKQRIEYEKKEFDELKERAREASDICDELKSSFTKHKKLTSNELARLKDLEKLIKKLRKDLGASGSSDVEEMAKPVSKKAAMERLFAEIELFDQEIQKVSRYAISVSAIDISNRILLVIGYLRS